MGGALLEGWIEEDVAPIEIVEPHPGVALSKHAKAAKIPIHKDITEVSTRVSACVVALKPQLLRKEAPRLKPIADSGALMISIAAGTPIRALARAWGNNAHIVRAMPNTPGAIGYGITALYAPPKVNKRERALADKLLGALGETVWVGSEAMIDVATAVSGSGPAYVFLLVEALTAAGHDQGLPHATAEQLARATIIGAGALLDADGRSATELRKEVTSPGGTTEAALKVLTRKAGMRALMARAVAAANRRAKILGI